MLPWYIASAVVVKTSLLGLGLVTLGLCVIALVLLRLFGTNLSQPLQHRIGQIFRTGIYLHLAAYLLLLLKMLFIDGWQDVPAFMMGHLLMHHASSALIATILLLMTIRIYNHRHSGRL
ncbi:hypothetical protein [Rheinheimera sp.]|uniref:hypothetical protein n=1 Tax=Rheinheimera sp. TaxID=1869214 RepID=UPI0027BAACE1|nr:hypothetical protein [Rheinheimera sp.]